MASDLVLKLAALVIFTGLLGGATYAAYEHFQPQGLTVAAAKLTPVESQRNGTAGHTLTFAVKLDTQSAGPGNYTLSAHGQGIGDQAAVKAASTAGAPKVGAFVPVTLPSDIAPGTYPVKLRAANEAGQTVAESTVTLRVLAPGPGLTPEQDSGVIYVGRFADGGLFNSNHPVVAHDETFPRDPMYTAGEGALTVRVGERANVIRGFARAVEGIQVGETRSFVVPPADGYGDAFVNETQERVSEIERKLELPMRTDKVARRSFDQYVNSTNQGPGNKYAPGSTFELRGQGGALPFEVVNITAAEVHYRIAVKMNNSYTLYGYFPNASKVVSLNETHVTFMTTPILPAGATFTFHEHWPNASAVDRVTDDKIYVRHSPRIGMTYDTQASPFAPPREYTVTGVTADGIVVQYANPSPLGGKTLVFDVTRVS